MEKQTKDKKRKFVSIQSKFTTLLLFAAIFITVSISISVFRQVTRIYNDSYEEVIQGKIDLVDAQLGNLMTSTERIAESVLGMDILKEKLTEKDIQKIYHVFEQQKELYPEIVNMIFSRYDSVLIFPLNDAVANQVPGQQAWFLERVEANDDEKWVDPYIDAASNSWIMTYYKRIIENGKTIGFIEIDISLEHITDLISNIEIGEAGKMYITQDGNILISRFLDLTGHDLPDVELYEAVKSNTDGSLSYMSTNERKFAVYSQIKSHDSWKVVGVLPEREISVKILKMLVILIITITILFTISVGVNIVITKKITKNITFVNERLQLLGEGDLTADFTNNSNDEIQQMGEALNHTVGGIRQLIRTTQDTSNTLLDESNQISAIVSQTTENTNQITLAIQEIADGSVEQADETNYIVEYFGNLSEAMQSITNSITDIDQMVVKTQDMNAHGVHTVTKLLDATELTNEATDIVRQTIDSISKTSNEIDTIVETINEISTQTNLLALNASIEAAKAGESGRGFAVVAEEVRKLAEDSAKSAGDIKLLIDRVKQQSSAAVEEISVVTKNSKDQTKEVENTQQAFSTISDSITNLSRNINDIDALNKNMIVVKEAMMQIIESFSVKVQQNSNATQRISSMTQEQLATMTSLETSLGNLTSCAEQLQVEITKFKTE